MENLNEETVQTNNDSVQKESALEKTERWFSKVFEQIKSALKKINKKILIIVAAVLILVIFILAMIGLSVYKFHFENNFTRGLMRVLPYPAALVNGHIISYYDWQTEVTAVMKFNQKKFGTAKLEEIEKEVMNKLIYENLLRQLAKSHKIVVEEDDINKNTSVIANQLGGVEALKKNVFDFFGWDIEEFKTRIVYPETLKEKLQAELKNSKKSQDATKKEASDLLEELKDGKLTFEEAAQKYSDDKVSGAKDGDLGFFPRGVMVKEFEEVAFNLKPGELSGLVKSDFGYHIIKLVEIKPADEKTKTEEQIKASHILIAWPSFTDYFNDYKAKAKITKFVALDK
ncbi:MAG: peptidylprolyl isomerase [Patescibacteria group bacterium]